MGRGRLKAFGQRVFERLAQRAARMSLVEIPRDRDAAQACLRDAIAAYELGDRIRAEAQVRMALEHDLGESDAHLFLARLLSARGALDESGRCFALAACYARAPAPILGEGGRLLAAKGQEDAALTLLRQCLEADPHDAEAACLAGELELPRDVARAAAMFRHALSVRSDYPRAEAGLAKIQSCSRPE